MSLQARMSSGDNRLYSAVRDVAHNFGEVIMEVARRCEDGTWAEMHALLRKEGVSDTDLGRACQALCRFVTVQMDVPKESMPACLARCGLFDCPLPARVAVMAYLGTVALGMHWAGVREATLGGVGPALTYKKLRWHGMRCAKLMRLPAWRRRLYMLWGRLRRAWRALWEKNVYDS